MHLGCKLMRFELYLHAICLDWLVQMITMIMHLFEMLLALVWSVESSVLISKATFGSTLTLYFWAPYIHIIQSTWWPFHSLLIDLGSLLSLVSGFIFCWWIHQIGSDDDTCHGWCTCLCEVNILSLCNQLHCNWLLPLMTLCQWIFGTYFGICIESFSLGLSNFC